MWQVIYYIEYLCSTYCGLDWNIRDTKIKINILQQLIFCFICHPMCYIEQSPPTSEAGVRFPAQPQVGKLVVACRWLAVYSTEP